MRVLIFSGEVMPFNGVPSEGGGLRAWQLYSGLRAHGVDVVASMPRGSVTVEEHLRLIPEKERSLLWDEGRQQEIFRRVNPDVVIYTPHWEHREFFPLDGVPLVVDLSEPRYLGSERVHARERKVRVLSEADCLLVAGKRQSFYFAGWLLQAGRIVEDELFILTVPYSLPPELPLLRPFRSGEMPQVIEAMPFFSGNQKGASGVPALGISLSPWSIERELLMPREILHLLWCGSPVLCDRYFEGAELIKSYQAGWFVEPEEGEVLSRVRKEILSAPDLLFERGKNAQRLIVEHHTWDRTIQPLLDFLRCPKKREKAHPVLGTSFHRQRSFKASGPFREVALPRGVTESFFTVPEANISAVELPFRIGSLGLNRLPAEDIEVRVCRLNGGVLAKKRAVIDSLSESGVIRIPFTPRRLPKAGEELCLRLEISGSAEPQPESGEGGFFCQQVVSPEYPALTKGMHLAVILVPGEPTPRQKFLLSARRALVMIRQGDTERLFRAMVRRMPRGAQRIVKALNWG